MKKLFVFAAAAIFTAALAVSCQEKEIEVNVLPSDNTVIFTCTIDQPDSKVAIDEAGKTRWEVGDEILINAGAGGNTRETVKLTADDISNDGKTARIVVTIDPYDRSASNIVSKYYALYPASAVAPLPLYYNQAFTNTNAKLMVACNVGNSFAFKNICGVIAFKVKGEFDNYVFSGNNGETVAYDVYQVRIRDDGEGPKTTIPKPTDSYKTLTPATTLAGEVVADGTTVNYICLPGGANFTGGFNFKFYDGQDLVKVAKTETAVNVALNKFLALGDISVKLEDYVAPQVSDHKSQITGATDISAQQANCFVITAPGKYKFPAIKGEKGDAAGNVFGAEIVWETYNNATDVVPNSVISAVDFEDNWIYFQTPETLLPGNALIAAKDFSGKIIWSWHIWIPQTKISNISANLFGAQAMSRNLGALVDALGTGEEAIESCGLFYQFGRKDPFPGAQEFGKSDMATISTSMAEKSEVQITVAESILKPTMFAYKGDTAVDPTWDGANWCVESGDYWGAEGDKTIYDPCPAGYRVPKHNESAPVWSVDNWEHNKDQYWYKKLDGIFPRAGYMDDCGGSRSKVGERNKLWFADSASNKSGHCLYVKASSVEATSTHKACGGSVRCVLINGDAPQPEPEPEPGSTCATSVKLDASFDDWANAEAISNSGSITEWKYGYNDDYLCFYFKIKRSDIIAAKEITEDLGYSFLWRRYIYIGIDTDNDSSTGATVTSGSLSIEGCEVKAIVYPFRGYSTSASGTDGSSVVNGVDDNPEAYIQYPVGTATGEKVVAYGVINEDFGILEIGIPRAAIGSPTLNKMNVQFSLSSNLTAQHVISF